MLTWTILHIFLSFTLHISTLTLLALRRSQLPPYNKPSAAAAAAAGRAHIANAALPAWVVRAVAVLAATCTILIPVLSVSDEQPLTQCGLRIICVFYALKVLDLGVARAERPPTRLCRAGDFAKVEGVGNDESRVDDDRGQHRERNVVPMHSKADVAQYVFALCTQMRYLGFDIATKQPGRGSAPADSGDVPASWRRWNWTVLPLLAIPILAFLVPIAETKCLLLLLLIQFSLEGLHTLLHPRCAEKLFYQPFAAATMGGFWTRHWHACADSFLRSLAYQPGRKLFGRGFGIISAFSLTGAWHGWASAALSEMNTLAWMVWGLFVMFGMLCLLEKVIWGERQGGLTQRILVWSCALTGAGMCWRELECSCKIDWVKNEARCAR